MRLKYILLSVVISILIATNMFLQMAAGFRILLIVLMIIPVALFLYGIDQLEEYFMRTRYMDACIRKLHHMTLQEHHHIHANGSSIKRQKCE